MIEGIGDVYKAFWEAKKSQLEHEKAELGRFIEGGMTPFEAEMLILKRKEVAALERASLDRRGMWP